MGIQGGSQTERLVVWRSKAAALADGHRRAEEFCKRRNTLILITTSFLSTIVAVGVSLGIGENSDKRMKFLLVASSALLPVLSGLHSIFQDAGSSEKHRGAKVASLKMVQAIDERIGFGFNESPATEEFLVSIGKELNQIIQESPSLPPRVQKALLRSNDEGRRK